MEYFSIIFKVKKCALYSIKYGKSLHNAQNRNVTGDKHSSLSCPTVGDEEEKRFITFSPEIRQNSSSEKSFNFENLFDFENCCRQEKNEPQPAQESNKGKYGT
jgi:hypothetical protein